MADNSSNQYKEALKQIDNLIKKQEAVKKSVDSVNDLWQSVGTQLFKISGSEFFKQVPQTTDDLKELTDEVVNIEKAFSDAGDVFTKALSTKEKSTQVNALADSIKKELGGAFTKTSNMSQELLSTYYKQLKDVLGDELKDEAQLRDLLSGKIKDQDVLYKKLKEQDVFRKAELDYATDYDKKQDLIKKGIDKLKLEHKELHSISDQEIVNLADILAKTEKLEDGTANWKEVTKDLSGQQRQVLALLHDDSAAMVELNNSMNSLAESSKNVKDKMLQPKNVFDLGKAMEAVGQNMKKDLIGSLMQFDEVLHNVQKNTGIMMTENSTSFAMLTSDVAQFGVSVEQAGQLMSDMSSKLNTTDFSVLSKAAKDFASIEGATGASIDSITEMGSQMMLMGQTSSQVKDAMEGADKDARKFGVSSKKVIEGMSKNMVRFRTMGFSGGEESLKKMVITAEKLHMSVDSIFNMADKARNIEGAMEMASELQLAGGSFANINPMDLLSAARKGPQELQKILGKMGTDTGKWVTDMKGNRKYEFDPIDHDRIEIAAKAAGVSVDDFQKMIAQNAMDVEKLRPFDGMLNDLDEADKDLAKSGLSQMLKMGKDGKIELDVDSDMAKRMGVKSMEQLQAMSGQELKTKMEADAKTLEEQNVANQSTKKSFDNFINSLMGALNVFQPVLEGLGWILQEVTKAFNMLPGFGKTLVAGLLVAFTLFGSSVGAFITQGMLSFGSNVLKFTKGVGSFAKSTFDFLKKMVTGKGVEALGGVKSKATGMISGLKDKITNKISTKNDDENDESKTKIDNFKNIGEKIKSTAAMIKDGVIGIFQTLRAVVKELIGIVTDSFVSLMDALGRGFVKFFEPMKALANPQTIIGIAVFVGAMIGLGYAFKLVGEGLASAAPGIKAILEGVGVIIQSVGVAITSVITTMTDSIIKLSSIDPMGLIGLAAGLGVLSIALVAFGAAMLTGSILSFFGGGIFDSIMMLATISPAIVALSEGINSIATGLDKLGEAADKLSLDKLEKLKELSDSMANASAGGGALNAVANAITGGGGAAGGQTIKVEVDLKLNGRDIQTIQASGKVGSTHNV